MTELVISGPLEWEKEDEAVDVEAKDCAVKLNEVDGLEAWFTGSSAGAATEGIEEQLG